MKYKAQKNRMTFLVADGFSLVETLVAVTMLLIAIAGVMTMAQGGLQSAVAAKDQMIATYLAQEVSEYIRNTRDTNLLVEGRAWDESFDKCAPNDGCRIESSEASDLGGILACPASGCPLLRYDEVRATYSYDTNLPQSRFNRKVVISPARFDAGGVIEEYLVDVTVFWTGTKGGSQLRLVSSLHRRN
jgi:type II secretory pathway pseudopilin PulG